MILPTVFPLRRQIALAALLLALPLVGSAFWAANQAYQQRLGELRSEVAVLAVTLGAYIAERLESVDAAGLALAAHPAVRTLDRAEASRLFAALLPSYPSLLNIVLVDLEGVSHGAALHAEAPDIHFQLDAAWVARVLATGRPAVGDFEIGFMAGKPTVVLGYPVYGAENVLQGVLGMGLDLGQLQRAFAAVPLPEESIVTLTDRESRILARSRDAALYVGRQVGSGADGQGPTLDLHEIPPVRERVGLDGVPRILGSAVVEEGPWLVSVGIPTHLASARALAGWRHFAGTLLAGLAAYLVLTLLLSRAVMRPVARLEAAAQRIAAGDLARPDLLPPPNREMAGLQQAFTTMAHRLRASQEERDRQIAEERRMREEVQTLQQQTVRQERLAAVGQLVSGVAHELNNPLQVVVGLSEMLETQIRLPPDVRRDLGLIRAEGERAGEIIRNLLLFVRQQPSAPGAVDLREVVSSVVLLRKREIEHKSISLNVRTGSVRPVMAVFAELQQVLLNFIVNAEHALAGHDDPGSGGPGISIRMTEDDDRVRVEVSDNGPGVRPEDEARLFQPFFTTKPVGQGTGLGLSVSYGIIESYGGRLGYRRNELGGATFYFELPVADQKVLA